MEDKHEADDRSLFESFPSDPFHDLLDILASDHSKISGFSNDDYRDPSFDRNGSVNSNQRGEMGYSVTLPKWLDEKDSTLNGFRDGT